MQYHEGDALAWSITVCKLYYMQVHLYMMWVSECLPPIHHALRYSSTVRLFRSHTSIVACGIKPGQDTLERFHGRQTIQGGLPAPGTSFGMFSFQTLRCLVGQETLLTNPAYLAWSVDLPKDSLHDIILGISNRPNERRFYMKSIASLHTWLFLTCPWTQPISTRVWFHFSL